MHWCVSYGTSLESSVACALRRLTGCGVSAHQQRSSARCCASWSKVPGGEALGSCHRLPTGPCQVSVNVGSRICSSNTSAERPRSWQETQMQNRRANESCLHGLKRAWLRHLSNQTKATSSCGCGVWWSMMQPRTFLNAVMAFDPHELVSNHPNLRLGDLSRQNG